MTNKLSFSFQQDLDQRLKNPAFKKAWEKSNLEYQIARQIIEKRLLLKISQRALAKRAKTTQAIISRIETMVANPTISFLDRLAGSLGMKVDFRFS